MTVPGYPIIGYRIELRRAVDPEWEWTATLVRWDGTEWRVEASEDGDTQTEALAELRTEDRRARRCEVVELP